MQHDRAPSDMAWVQNPQVWWQFPFLWPRLPNCHPFSARAEHCDSGKLKSYFYTSCARQGQDKTPRFYNQILFFSKIIERGATTSVNFKAMGRKSWQLFLSTVLFSQIPSEHCNL